MQALYCMAWFMLCNIVPISGLVATNFDVYGMRIILICPAPQGTFPYEKFFKTFGIYAGDLDTKTFAI